VVPKLIQCPFCLVYFCTFHDLALHLAKFGVRFDFHMRNMICLHCRAEHQDLASVDGFQEEVSILDCPIFAEVVS
jgi:hypothetical protein